MKFTIDVSKWRCGGRGDYKLGTGATMLLNDDGYMCCLGQIQCQLGLSEDDIRNLNRPEECAVENILSDYDEDGDIVEYYDTPLAEEAIGINDNETLTTQERIEKLTELFNRHGHELEFINA